MHFFTALIFNSMHTDARQPDNNTIIEGDICIVGAGAAGISITLEWMNTKYKVILLEGGGFEYDDKMQDLYAGKTTGQHYFPLKSVRLHYFGGTTGHWAVGAPFDQVDFKERLVPYGMANKTGRHGSVLCTHPAYTRSRWPL